MYDLHGKVALVTGAGGEHGIGRAIAIRLAAEGADLVVNDVIARPYAESPTGWAGLAQVVREIEEMGRRAIGAAADISDAGQVDKMVSEALDAFGHIDILVNNAGSRPGCDRVPVVDLEEEALDTVLRVNVKGTFFCCKAVGRHMIQRGGGGKIIIISSAGGKRGVARCAAYCASKFALLGLTQSMAHEMAPYRVNVNAICPGSVGTERFGYIADALAPEGASAAEYREQFVREAAAHIPLGRIANGSDIAAMAAFLASAESDYLTGLSVLVTGGEIMY